MNLSAPVFLCTNVELSLAIEEPQGTFQVVPLLSGLAGVLLEAEKHLQARGIVFVRGRKGFEAIKAASIAMTRQTGKNIRSI